MSPVLRNKVRYSVLKDLPQQVINAKANDEQYGLTPKLLKDNTKGGGCNCRRIFWVERIVPFSHLVGAYVDSSRDSGVAALHQMYRLARYPRLSKDRGQR